MESAEENGMGKGLGKGTENRIVTRCSIGLGKWYRDKKIKRIPDDGMNTGKWKLYGMLEWVQKLKRVQDDPSIIPGNGRVTGCWNG